MISEIIGTLAVDGCATISVLITLVVDDWATASVPVITLMTRARHALSSSFGQVL